MSTQNNTDITQPKYLTLNKQKTGKPVKLKTGSADPGPQQPSDEPSIQVTDVTINERLRRIYSVPIFKNPQSRERNELLTLNEQIKIVFHHFWTLVWLTELSNSYSKGPLQRPSLNQAFPLFPLIFQSEFNLDLFMVKVLALYYSQM